MAAVADVLLAKSKEKKLKEKKLAKFLCGRDGCGRSGLSLRNPFPFPSLFLSLFPSLSLSPCLFPLWKMEKK